MTNDQGFADTRMFKILGLCFISGVVFFAVLGVGGIIATVFGLVFVITGLISCLWFLGLYSDWKNRY